MPKEIANKKSLRLSLIRLAKQMLGIPQSVPLLNWWSFHRTRLGHHIWKRKYGTRDLIAVMQSLGMKRGSNVFIHSSWGEFYNYTGTEEELIRAVLEAIGPEGTLAMPAYPLRPKKTFNVRKSVTGAGLLCETFRQFPGVKRSINVRHSVCAIGPQSDFLLGEHHLGTSCWDEQSPYYRLSQINALVFGLGLTKNYPGTIIHCVESVLRTEVPYYADMFPAEPTTHRYIDYDGVEKTYSCYESDTSNRANRIFAGTIFCKKYFDKTCHRSAQISNLKVSVTLAAIAIPQMIALGRRGVSYYRTPSTKNYSFKKE